MKAIEYIILLLTKLNLKISNFRNRHSKIERDIISLQENVGSLIASRSIYKSNIAELYDNLSMIRHEIRTILSNDIKELRIFLQEIQTRQNILDNNIQNTQKFVVSNRELLFKELQEMQNKINSKEN